MKIKYNREVVPQDLSGHVLIPNSTNEPPSPNSMAPLSPTASCKPWGGTSVPRTRTASTPSATTSTSWLWILRRLLRWSHRSVWLFWRCFRRRQLHFPFVVRTIVNISISNDVIMQKSINFPHWRSFKPSVYTINCCASILSLHFKLVNWYLQIFFTSILSFFQQSCSLLDVSKSENSCRATPRSHPPPIPAQTGEIMMSQSSPLCPV